LFFLKYLGDQLSEQEKFLIYFYKMHPDNANFEFLDSLELKISDKIDKLVEQ